LVAQLALVLSTIAGQKIIVLLNKTFQLLLQLYYNYHNTAYLIPYTREWHDNIIFFCNWVSLLAKIEHISYNHRALVLGLIFCPWAGASVHIRISNPLCSLFTKVTSYPKLCLYSLDGGGIDYSTHAQHIHFLNA